MNVVAAPDFATLRGLLGRAIAAVRSDDPLLPITVVVPRAIARSPLRADLRRRHGGLLAVDVIAWPAWVESVAADEVAHRGGRRLPEAGFERLVARVLADTPRARRGPWLDAADTAGAARLLAATLADLLEGGFSADELAGVAALSRDPWRREIPALLERLLRAREAEGLWDRRRVEALAAELPADAGAGQLLLFGFHDLTPLQRAIVARQAEARDVALFVPGVSPDGALPGEGAVLPLLAWARDGGATVGIAGAEAEPPFTLRDDLFAAPSLRDPGPAALELLRADTEPAEVRAIAGRILEIVGSGERSWSDFLITIPPGGGPSPALFRRIFAKAGIPLRDAAGIPARATRGGRMALHLVRAFSGSRDPAARDALEFASPAELAARGFEEAAESFVRARDAREAAARFTDLYRARLGEEPTGAVLEALHAVALVHGERPLRLSGFADTFRAALSSLRERDDDGRGVLLTTMDAARGLSRAVAFHAGLVRGAVRGAGAEDPLLPDGLRAAIDDHLGWRGRVLRRHEDRREERLLLARFAFEAGTALRVLSFAERDRAGGEVRNPSGLLLDLASARAGQPLDPHGPEFATVVPARSRDAVLAHPADALDADLARFGPHARPTADDVTATLSEPRAAHLRAAWRGAEERWGSPRLGPWDGVLADPRAVSALHERLAGRRWSASALESMANCPFSFLVRVLHLGDPPEDTDDFDARERGSVFHAVYERIARSLAADAMLPLTPERLPAALDRLTAEIRRERDVVAAEPASRRIPRRATLAALHADLSTALAREAHRDPRERAVPVRFELAFGEEDEGPAATLDLGDGRTVPLRGKIDRLDRRPDGSVEVVDLKTGAVRAEDGSFRWDGPGGKTEVRLQLPLYLHAAAQVTGAPAARAAYWFATADAAFREVPYDATDLARDLDELRALVSHLLDRIRDGWFPCTPGAARCCFPSMAGACGPGVPERFLRKLADPAMVSHRAIVAGRTGPSEEAAS